MTQSPPRSGEYAETLHAPPSWWLMAAGFAVVVWWVFVLVSPMAFAIGAGVVAFAAAGLMVWRYGSVRITVGDGVVVAGGARIEVEHCGDADALDPGRTVAVRGREADARAFLLLRPYIQTSVRLTIDDRNDPAPYWLISSRRPKRLADAIESARRRATPTNE